jgi:hypothetical protein
VVGEDKQDTPEEAAAGISGVVEVGRKVELVEEVGKLGLRVAGVVVDLGNLFVAVVGIVIMLLQMHLLISSSAFPAFLPQ